MSLWTSLKKFYNYAKGDAKTGIWWHPTKQLASHNIKISLIFVRYSFGLFLLISTFYFHLSFVYHIICVDILLICLFAYLCWPLAKWHDVIKSWQGRLLLPVVQVASDFAVMSGFVSGILGK